MPRISLKKKIEKKKKMYEKPFWQAHIAMVQNGPKGLDKSCSCETAVRMLISWMGIADHAKKVENGENLAENQLLMSGLKEFEDWTFQYWNDLNLLEKRQNWLNV